jgi:transcriptional regulator with XRE-family HTH domain
MTTFGERVAQLRDERGWTQKELAERTGVQYETINRIENGKHTAPRVHVLVALARALGTTTDYLCGMYESAAAHPPKKRSRPRKTAPVS